MKTDEIILIFEKLTVLLGALGAFLGILYAGITTLIKDRTAARVAEAKRKTDEAEQKRLASLAVDDSRSREVDLADKLNAIQEKVVQSVEGRFIRLEKELESTNARLVTAETEKAEWRGKYMSMATKRERERTVVLTLLDGIQAGFAAREASPHTQNCAACLSQDQALLQRLQEVKKIYENGD